MHPNDKEMEKGDGSSQRHGNNTYLDTNTYYETD